MLLLLILADDFTGALDTGVQFAACGIPTRVVVGEQVDLAASDAAVLVVDTETRHLPAAEAYAVIAKLTRDAMSAGVFSIYKKTDSALRGNIGAELSALLKTSGERRLPFLPAFPQIDRVTRDGVHYISGVPVTESPFGIDPFEPVRHARVTELIGEQTDVPAHSFPTLKEGEAVPEQEGILVFDAGSLDDLASTGRALFRNGRPRLMAGCAGFAALLPDLMKMTERRTVTMPKLDPRLLVACGSVNSITLRQLDVAEQNGFSRLRLTPRQKLDPGYWESENGKEALQGINEMLAANPRCIIETNDEGGNQPTADYAAARGLDLEGLRVGIASSIGHMLGKLFTSPALGTLLLTGGDTLLQCMNCVGIKELEPVCEMEKTLDYMRRKNDEEKAVLPTAAAPATLSPSRAASATKNCCSTLQTALQPNKIETDDGFGENHGLSETSRPDLGRYDLRKRRDGYAGGPAAHRRPDPLIF